MSTGATDWKKSTVAELRDACTERSLATTGKKQELIDRLEEYDAQQGNTDIKDSAENGVKDECADEEKKEEMEVDEPKKAEPIMLLKGKFHFYYNVNHALKMVIINPIPEDNIQSPDLVKWLKEAKTFEIAKLPDGKCEAVLYFDTITKGDAAFADLKGNMENDEVKVIHPATADTEHPSNSVSISAGQYWDRIKEYSEIAKPPVTLEESKTESLFNRHVVLENVPESVTEDDLVKKFPEASSVHVYPYSEACRGIRMLEFNQESKVTSFLKENKNVEMDSVEIKLEKYSTRVAKWEKEKPKNEPYKPCTLEDDKRVELCQELKDLEKAKNSILNRDDLFGDEKILEHVTIHEKIRPLVEQLKMDTNRRKEEKLKFPEPDELKNNYTKFAEAPDFARRKKQSVFGRKQQEQDRKRPGDSWGYEPAYKRQNMMGGGYGRQGGYGGGGYGGGGQGLMNMVQGLQNALSSMGGPRRGGYGGGYGSGYGGGYGRGGMRGGRY